MKNKQIKITDSMQKVAVDILQEFEFCKTMEDVYKAYVKVIDKYDLCKDPFTYCVCTPKDYLKNSLELERQKMIEKYGHCDGLE